VHCPKEVEVDKKFTEIIKSLAIHIGVLKPTSFGDTAQTAIFKSGICGL
jgi:hypothetical protein